MGRARRNWLPRCAASRGKWLVNLILEARRIKHSNGVHCLLTAARCRERRDLPPPLSVFLHSSSSSSFVTMNWNIVWLFQLSYLPSSFPNLFRASSFLFASRGEVLVDAILTFPPFPFTPLCYINYVSSQDLRSPSFSRSLPGFLRDLSFRHSLDAGPPVIFSPSLPPLHSSAFPSIRDVIASHRAAIFSSPSLRVNLPIEISVGRGTEWSASRRRMMILLSSLATALFCGPRTSLTVIKLFTGPASLSFESRDEIARSHTIP